MTKHFERRYFSRKPRSVVASWRNKMRSTGRASQQMLRGQIRQGQTLHWAKGAKGAKGAKANP